MSDTQSMPAIEDEIQPPFPRRSGGSIRELPPEPFVNQSAGKHPPDPGGSSGKIKYLLLLAGFLLALFMGFALAGFLQDESEARGLEKARQEQQMADRERKLADQEETLREERRRLEEQKQALEARQKELSEESSRLKGRNEQLREESQAGGVDKLLDKVTGKDKQRARAARENEQQSAKLDSDTAEVRQSIQQAQQMLDDVDEKLDDLEAMQKEAKRIRGQVENAYTENKDSIDKFIYYAQQGAGFVLRLLQK